MNKAQMHIETYKKISASARHDKPVVLLEAVLLSVSADGS